MVLPKKVRTDILCFWKIGKQKKKTAKESENVIFHHDFYFSFIEFLHDCRNAETDFTDVFSKPVRIIIVKVKIDDDLIQYFLQIFLV